MGSRRRTSECVVCGERFTSRQKAATHFHRAHGVCKVVRMVTRTNQCIYCGETYANRDYAEQHAEKAMRRGACPRKTTKAWEYDLEEPEGGYECGICGERIEDGEEYNTHARLHAPMRASTIEKYYRKADGKIREAWELGGPAGRRRIRGKTSTDRLQGRGDR